MLGTYGKNFGQIITKILFLAVRTCVQYVGDQLHMKLTEMIKGE